MKVSVALRAAPFVNKFYVCIYFYILPSEIIFKTYIARWPLRDVRVDCLICGVFDVLPVIHNRSLVMVFVFKTSKKKTIKNSCYRLCD